MKKYIVAIDEGTSSVRAVVYDVLKNEVVLSRKEKLKTFYPQPGWVEQDAEEIFQKSKACLDDVLEQIDPALVFGIGITNQRETSIMWNKKTGAPVAAAISWQCRRTADFIKSLEKTTKHYIFKTTGLVPDAYFSASKFRWLLRNNKKAQALLKQQNLCAGTIDSFLVFRLTNKQSFVSDITNASRTMLVNIKTGKWDEKLLSIFGIDEQILPEIVENDKIVGYYTFDGTIIPIAGICGDQQSSLFGQACFSKGDAKITFGTGSFMLLNTGKDLMFSKHKLVTTIALKLQNKPITYAIEGSIFNCGTAVDWLEKIGLTHGPKDCDRLALEVSNTNEAQFVPAFTGLGAPYWEPKAKASLSGLLLNTQKGHIARAVLEGIAYSVFDVFSVLEKDFSFIGKTIKVDGGVSNSAVCMQTTSNMTQRKLTKSKEVESTSMGVIYLCGLALGVFQNLADIKAHYKEETTYSPKISLEQKQEIYKKWKDAIKRTI